jgi:hypothetical protein
MIWSQIILIAGRRKIAVSGLGLIWSRIIFYCGRRTIAVSGLVFIWSRIILIARGERLLYWDSAWIGHGSFSLREENNRSFGTWLCLVTDHFHCRKITIAVSGLGLIWSQIILIAGGERLLYLDSA